MDNYQAQLKYWLDELTGTRYSKEIHELAVSQSDRVVDAFYKDLTFGTGGLRGIIGLGPNRMNEFTIARASQGLSDYLKSLSDEPSVVLARDNRIGGELFIQTAVEVFAANGIKSLVFPDITPTPVLSFAVRSLSCTAGVCITASHNPAEYNGYKVYRSDGCQITTETARVIQKSIQSTDIFHGVRRAQFTQVQREGWVRYLDAEIDEEYISSILSQCGERSASEDIKVVYTPLHGTGSRFVPTALARVGASDVQLVELQMNHDSEFTTCPVPNPEFKPALKLGLDMCEKIDADLLLATDPDADRVGVAVKYGDGYRVLSGDEVGVLLLSWICETERQRGLSLKGRVVATTIVSSTISDYLADYYEFELRKTLTGFKFIGEEIGKLEEAGEAGRFLFAFEESCGYLAGTYIRDKDGVLASVLVYQMTRYYASQGISLLTVLNDLYGKSGYRFKRSFSVPFHGAHGSEKMDDIMRKLRIDGLPGNAELSRAVETCDYLDGVTYEAINSSGYIMTFPSSNVLEFRFSDGCKTMIRPSGTEPKIKIYLFSAGGSAEESLAKLDLLEKHVRSYLSES